MARVHSSLAFFLIASAALFATPIAAWAGFTDVDVEAGPTLSGLPGTTLDWTVAVAYVGGTGDVTNTELSLTLPSGWLINSVEPGCQGSASAVSGVWSLGTLSPGDEYSCTFHVMPTTLAALTSTARAQADYIVPSGVATFSSDTATFEVEEVIDLVIGVSVLETELGPGETTVMTVSVANLGNKAVVGSLLDEVVVEIEKGPLVFDQTISVVETRCRVIGGNVEFPPILVGEIRICDYGIRAPDDLSGGQIEIVATATTTGPQAPELYPADNTMSLDVRLAAPLELTVDVATDSTDATPGDGLCEAVLGGCTLRAAIVESNAWPEDDVIFVPSTATYVLTSLFGSGDEDAGDLDLRDTVTIIGGPPEGARGGFPLQSSIAGLDNTDLDVTTRVFEIPADLGVVATLRNLVIRDGEDTEGGGMRVGPGNELVLEDVTFVDNRSSGHGGGLWARSSVTGTDVEWIDNFSAGNGAGVDWAAEGGTLDLLRARFDGNGTSFGSVNAGGGLQMGSEAGSPRAYIRDSTFIHNRAHNGGAINTGVQTWITNTTISNNDAANSGGGIRAGLNTVRLAYSTVAFNDAGLDSGQQWTSSTGEGGGIWVNPSLATVRLYHSVVANNRARLEGSPLSVPKSAECSGSLTSDGVAVVYVVTIDSECSLVGAAGDLINTDPQLSPLTEPAGYHVFPTSSPLLDLGETSCFWDDDGDLTYDAPLDADQTGRSRPLDSDGDFDVRCDPGAIERGEPILPESVIFIDGFESGGLIAWQ